MDQVLEVLLIILIITGILLAGLVIWVVLSLHRKISRILSQPGHIENVHVVVNVILAWQLTKREHEDYCRSRHTIPFTLPQPMTRGQVRVESLKDLQP